MKNIVVVGCGNIGSRLIQSLSNINSKKCGAYNIIGVEPFPKAWPVVQERFDQENKGNHSFTLIDSPTDLPETADLMVFAMDARNRLAALTDALAVCQPKNILLEKILFTKPEDYKIAAGLIEQVAAKCWVNTSRNVWPGYQALKEKLSGHQVSSFTVSGSDWGLGCNAIHFLAAYEYISGQEITNLNLDLDSVSLQDSKRAGYCELTGKLLGESGNGVRISVESLAASNIPISVKVNTSLGDYAINEGGQKIVTAKAPDHEDHFGLYYTSQLNGMFEEILLSGHSDLPTFEQSTRLHLLLIKALNQAFHGEATLAYECPIT